MLPVFLMFIALVSLGIASPSSAATPWVVGEIDAAVAAGNSATALGPNGKVHAAYYDETHNTLMHATNDSGAWLIETVDASGAGRNPSIAVDSNSKVYVSYDDTGANTVKYATNASGSWVLQTVATNAGKSSIALATNGIASISYVSANSLQVATNATGSWVNLIVDIINNDGVGRPRSSIKVDSSNKVHIGYVDIINSVLMYATNSSGAWHVQTVDSINYSLEQTTSLAVDTNNKIHISYALLSVETGTTLQALNYATNASGQWMSSTVDQQEVLGESSLALDSFNNVHIAYRSFDWHTTPNFNRFLKYATNTAGTFAVEFVDKASTDYSNNLHAGLALDSLDNVHMIFTTALNSDSAGKLAYVTNMSDVAPPIGAIDINSGLVSTATSSVLLTLPCNDGAGTGCVAMSFSNDGAPWSLPEAYAPARSWALSSGDGEKTVSVKFMDVAGNWSIVYADTIILETNYVITADTYGNGGIWPSGGVSLNPGGSQTFTFTPNPGYFISGVLVDDVPVDIGKASSFMFTNVTANHTIRVGYSTSIYVIYADRTDGGNIWPAANTITGWGDSKVYTIIPSAGESITDVLVDGVSVGAVSSYTFSNIAHNHTIHAIFGNRGIGYLIRATVASENGVYCGSTSPKGDVYVSPGASQTFTITENPGYTISAVIVDGVSVGAVSSYTFTDVNSKHTLNVVYRYSNYVVSTSAGTGGSISPPGGSVSVYPGDSQTFTFTPDPGYVLANVLVDGVPVGALSSYTIENVTAAHWVSASFSLLNGPVIAASIVGTGGSISPLGNVVLGSGASQTFSITPLSGCAIADVIVDGVSVGAVSSYTFTNVTTGHSIVASFNAATSYTIKVRTNGNGDISPAGVSCDNDGCYVAVTPGASQTFTFTPNTGHYINGVQVDGARAGSVYSYTFTNVTGNHDLGVDFERSGYNISISFTNNGNIILKGSSVIEGFAGVPYGYQGIFEVRPDPGYIVDDVLVDGVSVGAVYSYTFVNVIAPHTIHASFKLLPNVPTNGYAITALSGIGVTMSPIGIGTIVVNPGGSQTFTITPHEGYLIEGVFVDDIPLGAISSYTFTNVLANHVIRVNTCPKNKSYGISVYSSGNGSIFPSYGIGVQAGESQTFTFTPNAGYIVDNVFVDGIPVVGSSSSYTFTNVLANHSIYATYSVTKAVYSIAITMSTNGTILPKDSSWNGINVNAGESQTLTITPDEGYRITNVLVDNLSEGAVSSYTFKNIHADHTIKASFSIVNPPATGVTLIPAPGFASPQVVGAYVTFNAYGAGGSGGYEYEFWLETAGVWSRMQAYSPDSRWTWDTTLTIAGNYRVKVNVRSTGSPAPLEATTTLSYVLNSPDPNALLVSDPVNYQVIGKRVIFITGGYVVGRLCEFKFWLKTNGVWSVVRDYSPSNSWMWDTTGASEGTYEVRVYARPVGSTATYEASKTISYILLPAEPVANVSLVANELSPQYLGTKVMFTAGGIGGGGNYEYQFWLQTDDTGIMTLVQDYSANTTWTWDTNGVPAGTYKVYVYARNIGSNLPYEAQNLDGFWLQNYPASSATLVSDKVSPQISGSSVTFTAEGIGGAGSYEYFFLLKTGSVWNIMQDYSSTNTWTWDTSGMPGGIYTVQVWVRNTGSDYGYEALKSLSYVILADPPATSATLSPGVASPQIIGNNDITFTAGGIGGTGRYEYKFWLKTNGVWAAVQDYSPTNIWTWNTSAATAGSYGVQVFVRNSGSKAKYEVVKTVSYALSSPPVAGATLVPDKTSPQIAGNNVTFTAGGVGGSGNYEYKFWIKANGVWTAMQGYSASDTWTWNTAGLPPGNYRAQVYVRNIGSRAKYEAVQGMGYIIK